MRSVTSANQQDVGRLLHHQPRQPDRVLHVAQRAHGARAAVAAHDGRVTLDLAVDGQRRASPGVEPRIVLQDDDRGRRRVERRAARAEDLPAGPGGGSTRRHQGLTLAVLRRPIAGAAVHDERSRHRTIAMIGERRSPGYGVTAPITIGS
jgi:hypothetical protein